MKYYAENDPGILSRTETCPLCGESYTYAYTSGSEEIFSRDLDLRPALPRRLTMPLWLRECPHCGLILQEDGMIPGDDQKPRIRALLASRAYRKYSREDDLSARFLCAALVREALEDPFTYKSFLSASWVCEDLSMDEEAQEYRKKALQALEQYGTDDDETVLVKSDLQRRLGMFEAVLHTEKDVKDPVLRYVQAYEKELCRRKDVSGGHTLAEAELWVQENPECSPSAERKP